MAIDTRNERAGAISIALPFSRVFDNPNNAWDQADRQQTSLTFPGILAASTAEGQPARKRAYFVPGMYLQPGLFGPRAAT